MRNGPEKIKKIRMELTLATKNKTALPKAPQMGAETRWRPAPLQRVLYHALPMVHHSGQRHDSLEAGEKAKEYRRKTEKSGCVTLTSLIDLWLNQAHWALRVLCKSNTDLIDVDFQAIGCSGCSQKRVIDIVWHVTITQYRIFSHVHSEKSSTHCAND